MKQNKKRRGKWLGGVENNEEGCFRGYNIDEVRVPCVNEAIT